MRPTPLPLLRQLFLAFVLLATGAGSLRAGTDQEDQRTIDEMRGQVKALQQQMVGSTDPQQQLELQRQLGVLIDETLPRLSPKNRVMLSVALKIMQPMQEQGTAYIKLVADYSAAPENDFAAIKTQQEIRPFIARVQRIRTANLQLLDSIEAIPAAAKKVLDASELTAVERAGFEQGLLGGLERRMAPLRAIRNLDTRIYDLLIASLEQLERDWGKWEPGALTWSDSKLQAEFEARQDEMAVLGERQTKAQEALVQRM